MNTSHWIRLSGLVLAVSFLTSCAGYRLGNIPSAEMKGVKTIYVPVVKNESYEPSIQVMTTNEIIRKLETDGTYMSGRIGSSDATLEVIIKDVERSPKRYARDNSIVTQEYELRVKASFTLTNHITGKQVLKGAEASGHTDFFIQNDAQEGERQALPLALQDLAYDIVRQVTEGW